MHPYNCSFRHSPKKIQRKRRRNLVNNWKRKTRLRNRFRPKGRRETKGARKVGATRKINCVFEKEKKTFNETKFDYFCSIHYVTHVFALGMENKNFSFMIRFVYWHSMTYSWKKNFSRTMELFCCCELEDKVRFTREFVDVCHANVRLVIDLIDLTFSFRFGSSRLFDWIVYLQLKSPSQ